MDEGINKFIEKESTDILAMVAHRHNLFERMFGKVHAKAISYQTKIHYWYCRVNKAIQMKEIEKRILNKKFSYKVDQNSFNSDGRYESNTEDKSGS